jgi:hypothetical protein
MGDRALSNDGRTVHQGRGDGDGLIGVYHWDDLDARVYPRDGFEEEDGGGEGAEEVSGAGEEAVAEGEVAEGESFVGAAQT